MKTWLPILLLLPSALLAQDDLWDDDAWGDEKWGDEEQNTVWSGFVEAGLAEVVDDDPDPATVSVAEQVVQERRLACPEVPTDHSQRDRVDCHP